MGISTVYVLFSLESLMSCFSHGGIPSHVGEPVDDPLSPTYRLLSLQSCPNSRTLSHSLYWPNLLSFRSGTNSWRFKLLKFL